VQTCEDELAAVREPATAAAALSDAAVPHDHDYTLHVPMFVPDAVADEIVTTADVHIVQVSFRTYIKKLYNH